MRKYIAFVLIILITLSTFTIYPFSAEVESENEYSLGFKHGKTLGEMMGKLYGQIHFTSGKVLDWRDQEAAWNQIPEMKEFIERYKSEDEFQLLYNKGLEDGFKQAFIVTYIESYQDSNLNTIDIESGLKDGKASGEYAGEKAGMQAFLEGEDNNWTKFFEKIDIVKKYNLDKDSEAYKEAFIAAFTISFKQFFQDAYRQANLDNANGEENEELGKQDGEGAGSQDGKNAAKKDMSSGKESNWSVALQSEKEIGIRYELFNADGSPIKHKDYIKAFFEAYYEAFERAYLETYVGVSDDTSGMKEGENLGGLLGAVYGYQDFINGETNDWKDACPRKRDIERDYELKNETDSFRENFVNGFEKGFKNAYEKAFRSANFDGKEESYKAGMEHGGLFGTQDGETYGRKDYYEKRSNDWTRDLPTDRMIKEEYSLSNDTQAYTDGFIVGYKIAYEKSYINAYRDANVSNEKITRENGLKHGREIGAKVGEAFGLIDYTSNKTNNWQAVIPTDEDIVAKYQLLWETPLYKEGFIAGYKDGFKSAYASAFQAANMSKAIGNANYISVSMEGATITSYDKVANFLIPSGSFYKEVFFSLEKGNFPEETSIKPYEPASYIYYIDVANPQGNISIREPMTLSFKYYGPDTAGVYQLVNNQWRYLFSTFEEGIIKTKIPVGNYTGGTYAVFIDEHYKELTDIYTHWAKDEVYTFLRRYYVSGYPDKTFKPDNHISRAEFIFLLGRVLRWDIQGQFLNTSYFKDAKNFGMFEKVISYAYTYGYISGYPDRTFRPTQPISYREIEWIMSKIIGDSDFSWDEIAEKIKYEKYIKSKGLQDKNEKITRAEVVYLLNVLQDQNKL